MIVYGDRRERLSPALALLRLRAALDLVGDPQVGGTNPLPAHIGAVPQGYLWSSRHAALVELLIEAGIVEQAVADALSPDQDTLAVPKPLLRLTDLAADAVAHSLTTQPGQAGSPPDQRLSAALATASEPASDDDPHWWTEWDRALRAALAALRHQDLPPTLWVTLPEGYLFYALYPEAYLLRAQQAIAGAPAVVVVGLRSIGVSLGAMAAAACRQAGLPHLRLSLRPRGDAFNREIGADTGLVEELRAWAGRGTLVLIVDEGPGLSGSSLAATARFIGNQTGLPAARIAFLCANPWPGPQAPAWVQQQWQAHRHWIVDPLLPSTPGSPPHAALRALPDGRGLEVLADLSGGAWRSYTHLSPQVVTGHPRFERRKYLCRAQDGPLVWAKFIGLGRVGRAKAARAAALARAGLTPPYLGYAHGYLLSAHVAAPPLEPAQSTAAHLQRIACYIASCGQLAAAEPPDPDGLFSRLQELVIANTRAWFGPTLDAELATLGWFYGAVEHGYYAGGDGKPQPHEWLATVPPLKCDAADHHLDHGPVYPLDACYDLAGVLFEWSLSPAQSAALLTRYVTQSADHGVHQRLPYYRAVYCAALLGQHDLAYHLEEGHPRVTAAYDDARRRYATELRSALADAARVTQPLAAASGVSR